MKFILAVKSFKAYLSDKKNNSEIEGVLALTRESSKGASSSSLAVNHMTVFELLTIFKLMKAQYQRYETDKRAKAMKGKDTRLQPPDIQKWQ